MIRIIDFLNPRHNLWGLFWFEVLVVLCSFFFFFTHLSKIGMACLGFGLYGAILTFGVAIFQKTMGRWNKNHS